MSHGLYILGGPDGHTPVPVEDVIEWVERREAADWRVARTVLPGGIGAISTVFLGIDHSFGRGPPLLFETMSFLGDENSEDYFDRYSTWDEASAGHTRIVMQAMADIEHAAALAADALVPTPSSREE